MKNLFLSAISIALVGVIAFAVNTIAPTEKISNNSLPKVETLENLASLLKSKQESEIYYIKNGAVMEDMAAPTTSNKEQSSTDKTEYSETNVQVQGVDEADIVKTDGDKIYQVNRSKIVIVDAYPASEMKVSKEIKYADNDDFVPQELYVDDNYLVIIGNTYTNSSYSDTSEKMKASIVGYPYYRNETHATALVYDKVNYNLEKRVEVDGNYISSRKIGDSIYLISNKYVYSYGIENNYDLLPTYKDTCVSNEYAKVDVASICYFPDFTESSYMITAGFNLSKLDEEVNISTYLGAGSEIYSSEDNLYVTMPKYDNTYRIMTLENVLPKNDETKTSIYKFNLDNGKIVYDCKGEVKGLAINQFAMDEYNGNFRIATTDGNTWDDTSNNNLYILDKKLNVIGKVEGLAEGEKIYSVRFMGDKAYMVTYKNVDPLFVIDVSLPTAPKVLGELKIPGYSSYLHPYKENYLIGFGKDTVVKTYKDYEGNVQETAYEVGMKLALFDVTDFSNPKELYSIRVGDRGSYSDLLYNHKALLFDEEKGIIAFPATVTKSTGTDSEGVPNYGEEIFEGALVYSLDLENGFTLKAKISHDKVKDDIYYPYYYNQNAVQRILYINDTLYTTSLSMIKANNLNTFEEINKISL